MIPLAKVVSGWSQSTAVEPVPLTWNEALSGIFGSISLACWIFLLAPQLYENYKAKSAAGLSVAFLVIWFIGDVTNFFGAVLAGLVPTVIAVSVWYLFSDAALLGQTVYYNYMSRRGEAKDQSADQTDGDLANGSAVADEHAPLLRRSSVDVPGSRRRNSSNIRRASQSAGSASLPALDEADADGPSTTRRVLTNIAAVAALFVAGTLAWAIAYGVGAWQPTPPPSTGDEVDSEDNTVAIILGYVSAVCYLGARIPQIIKNYREKSCEGLSLLFFILSMLGNTTYGAQILFHSLERKYLLTNLPWLIGSVGTISEDMTIFAQFRLYRKDVAVGE